MIRLPFGILFTILILTCAIGLIAGFIDGFNRGQKDALRGQQKYNMEVHYRYEVQSTLIEPNNDSSTMLYKFVPFDTTFVKK
jgi:hypothetical protein